MDLSLAVVSGGVALVISVATCVFSNWQIASQIREKNIKQTIEIIDRLKGLEKEYFIFFEKVIEIAKPGCEMSNIQDAYDRFVSHYSDYLNELMIQSAFFKPLRKAVRAKREECFLLFDLDDKIGIAKLTDPSWAEYYQKMIMIQFIKSTSFIVGRFKLYTLLKHSSNEKGWFVPFRRAFF